MKVLVVGSGGREHALAWAMARSPRVDRVFCAPGNGGTAGVGTNVPIAATDVRALVEFASTSGVDLTVVGPEAPLVAGIVDRFEEAGLRCFGPKAAAARLEGSKVFAKEFMARHGVPTAGFRVFDDAHEANSYVRGLKPPVVVKADGLAAGKGVYVADSTQAAVDAVNEIMVQQRFGQAGGRIVVEECLRGEEVSVHAICAGNRAVMLPSSQDHKRIFDGDRGPNTGGMGAYAPVPSFGDREREGVMDTVVSPVLAGMAAEGNPYTGALYAGLMITAAGPMVLEFNVRFGDPETQVLLPLVRSDLFEVLYRATSGDLPDEIALWEERSAATVVMASGGYPGTFGKGFEITGLDGVECGNAVVFHAGTSSDGERLVSSGGRVLAVTAWDRTLGGALDAAYQAVGRIRFEKAYWRTDIGRRAL
jgi:phosphoribosylamine--glycine ligase